MASVLLSSVDIPVPPFPGTTNEAKPNHETFGGSIISRPSAENDNRERRRGSTHDSDPDEGENHLNHMIVTFIPNNIFHF